MIITLTVENESAATADAVEVLMERLPASKVARLLSSWQMGRADYLKLREELFAGETVESLYKAASQPGQRSVVPLPDADGLLHSRVFPSLRLPVCPLLASDTAKLLATLTAHKPLNRKPPGTSLKSRD